MAVEGNVTSRGWNAFRNSTVGQIMSGMEYVESMAMMFVESCFSLCCEFEDSTVSWSLKGVVWLDWPVRNPPCRFDPTYHRLACRMGLAIFAELGERHIGAMVHAILLM